MILYSPSQPRHWAAQTRIPPVHFTAWPNLTPPLLHSLLILVPINMSSITTSLSFQICYRTGTTQCTTLWFGFFTQHNSLEVNWSCCVYQHFIHFYSWVISLFMRVSLWWLSFRLLLLLHGRVLNLHPVLTSSYPSRWFSQAPKLLC